MGRAGAAYESLPADDADDRRVYLLKIAEVWERGQHDVDRALAALERAFHLDTSRHRPCAPSCERIGARVRPVGSHRGHLPGRRRRVRPDRDRGGAAPRRRALARRLGQIDKAEQLYHAILRLKSDDVTVALDRIEEICRDAGALGGSGEPARAADQRADRVAAARPRAAREVARAGRALRGTAREARTRRSTRWSACSREIADEDGAHGEAQPTPPPSRARRWPPTKRWRRLYSRVGLWAKVVESLQHAGRPDADKTQARALRLRIADVYEKELALARARRRGVRGAARPRSPTTRRRWRRSIACTRRTAASTTCRRSSRSARRWRPAPSASRSCGGARKILEDKLNNPEAAAAALRELGADAIADDEMLAALLRNLRRAGLAHEAARVLTQRIEIERAPRQGRRRTRTRIAELNLELSLLKLDDLNDPAAARKEVEAALEAAPDNPAALARAGAAPPQGRTTSPATPRRASARPRRWRASPRRSRRCWTPAASTASRSARPTRPATCFEEALREDPRQRRGAARAGGAAASAEANWDEARRVLERQLEITERPEARAAVLTDLGRASPGRVQRRAPRRSAISTRRWRWSPTTCPAILAIADIYYKEGQWEQAEKRLTEAVRRLRGQPQQAAQPVPAPRRGAREAGQAGRGVSPALEADRMGPGQLLDQAVAGREPLPRRQVARGGAAPGRPRRSPRRGASTPTRSPTRWRTRAQAEIKLRRPERAIELYEAALRAARRPPARRCARWRTWRSSAARSEKAASYLRRMAEESSDRAERAQTAGAAGRSVPRARRRGAGAGGLRRGAARPRRAVGGAGAAAGEDAEAAARGRRRPRPRRRPRRCSSTWSRIPRSAAERRREAALLLAERGEVARGRRACWSRRWTSDPHDEEALAAPVRRLADRCRRASGWREDAGTRAGRAAAAADQPARPRRRARALAAARRAASAKRDPAAARSRPSSRSSRSTPEQLPRARGAGALYGDAPEHEDGGDREPPQAAGRRHHARRLAARAGARLRAPRADRSRALLLRGAGAARRRDRPRSWPSCDAHPRRPS